MLAFSMGLGRTTTVPEDIQRHGRFIIGGLYCDVGAQEALTF